jgi:NAD+ synthetase
MNAQNALYTLLIQELHQFAKNKQAERIVVGLSGGVNSAVALCIAVRAFGPKKVTALILPEMGVSPHEDIDHARALAQHFGCAVHYQPINNFLVDYHFITWENNGEAFPLLKTRVRSTLLHHYAESMSAMVLGTASKSDLALGLGVKDGEFTGALHILGDLYKSEVLELGRWIGLPEELFDKTPSRHLTPHQTDEDDLNGPWPKIDEILKNLSEGGDPQNLIEKGMDSLLVHKIVRLLEQNEASYKSYPIVDVSRVPESIKKAREAEAQTLI